MENQREPEINAVYYPLLANDKRYLLLYGGAGSGKSFFAAQKVLIRTLDEPGHRILCTRKVGRTLRDSVWALLTQFLHEWKVFHLFDVNKSEMRLRFANNGNEILCIGLDDPEKIKSIAGITSMWHEEPTELAPADFEQLDLRLRGKTPHYKQHILSFNPVSARHWLKREFFDNQDHAADSSIVKTTFGHNALLDKEYKDRLRKLKGNSRAVYMLGEWGIMEGAIYEQFIQPAEWPESFGDTIYGLDFGFNNPTALVECGLRDGIPHLRERIFKTGLTNGDLIAQMNALDISKTAPIYADPAEPARIEEIRRAGYNIHPAKKGQGSVQAGIGFCQSLNIHVHPLSANVIHENESYVWRKDKDGIAMDEPEKENDHSLDAMRYALFTHLSKPQGDRFTSNAFEGIGVFTSNSARNPDAYARAALGLK